MADMVKFSKLWTKYALPCSLGSTLEFSQVLLHLSPCLYIQYIALFYVPKLTNVLIVLGILLWCFIVHQYTFLMRIRLITLNTELLLSCIFTTVFHASYSVHHSPSTDYCNSSHLSLYSLLCLLKNRQNSQYMI